MTPLRESDLAVLLAKYGFERLESYWPASHGIENSNYFVRLASNLGPHEVVVTMLEQPASAGPLLVPLLDACNTAGLPVAPIIRNRHGAATDIDVVVAARNRVIDAMGDVVAQDFLFHPA